ncbi:MAG: transcriptional regulator, GntR family [Polaromonas sp.]|nr:transcriptional regulator, GntR family [Polaromonas sp.]
MTLIFSFGLWLVNHFFMNSRKTPSHFETTPPRRLEPVRRARRPRGLVDEIVETLAASIREGQLQTGDKLPTEAEIMVRFDVSRTVVRESLSKLQASRLVETRHGIGTFVLPPQEAGNFKITAEDFATVADVISVLELRISLETEAAGLAAQRRTPENLTALETALHVFDDSIHQNSDAVPPDFRFHMEVARATGNRHFADLMTYLGTMIIPRTRVNTAHSAPEGRMNYLKRVNSEHESIYNAIRDQDPEAARAAMRIHLSNSRERLRRGNNAHTMQPSGELPDILLKPLTQS